MSLWRSATWHWAAVRGARPARPRRRGRPARRLGLEPLENRCLLSVGFEGLNQVGIDGSADDGGRGPAEIHGAKFHDLDGDGEWDLGVEPGLPGVTVFLDYNDDGTPNGNEPSTETLDDDPATPGVDETGTYSFTGLTAGTYTVAEVVQDGWMQTYPTPPMELYALGSGVGDYRSDFYRIDNYATNPVAHYIGVSYIYNGPLADMAFDPTTGKIQAVAWATDKLYEIDRQDGHAIWYGARDYPSAQTAVTFDSSGQLYCWGSTRELFLVDKVTGQKTSLGNTGYRASGDLAFDLDGTLYGLAHNESAEGCHLLRIDPLTAEATILTSYDFPDASSLEIGADGTMYLARNITGDLDLVELYTVDKTTWQPTRIGAIPGTEELGLHGMAFLPSRRPGGTHRITLDSGQIRTGVDFGNRAVLDFGDAPDDPSLPGDYPTLRESDGARHLLSNRLFFGMGADAEPDGLPSPDALGDDLHLAADEEGVRFTSDLVPGETATMEFSTFGDGLLSAWIDFNGDADWDDPGEQIFADEPLSQGSNSRSFPVPASATPTDGTFARFRLSTAPGLSYDGFAPDGEVQDYRVAIRVAPGRVAARHVFYNDSKWDATAGSPGGDALATPEDDAAIAPDKSALLPGESATFENCTSYSKGINGIMVDIGDVPGTLTAADFVFRMGNDDNPDAWPTAPDPSSITLRHGGGAYGSDRVTILWPNYHTVDPDPTTQAVAKGWLQVTVKATPNTGLIEPDVFYFGNAVGDTGLGDFGSWALVNAVDSGAVRDNPRNPYLVPAQLDDIADFNRDQWVNAVDFGFVRDNATNPLSAVKLITAPSLTSSPGPEGAPATARIEADTPLLHDAAVAGLSAGANTPSTTAIPYPPGLSCLGGSDPSGPQSRSSKLPNPPRAALEKLLATL